LTRTTEADTTVLLEVDDLHVEFKTFDGVVHAVNGVTLTIRRGETLALVGESGSGKTVTALSIMGLVLTPGRIAAGRISFEGRDLGSLSEREYRGLRGGTVAMVFQDPLSSLNPSYRVGAQIAEALHAHTDVSKGAARARAAELLALVGIPQAAERARDYPHQFSGGMRQRAMIAMAIANSPRLLIADEPTTALDVTIQAQVLDVLRNAQRENDSALLLITHDLGVVAGLADRVAVMYAGRVVEEGDLDAVFYDPRHPYTVGLLESLPRLDSRRGEPLRTIPGSPPGLVALPVGCPFAPRCAFVIDRCREERPELALVPGAPERRAACWRADEVPAFRRAEEQP
jgi:oligopeptide/dipeptide ABC transporter ATP-binding protein